MARRPTPREGTTVVGTWLVRLGALVLAVGVVIGVGIPVLWILGVNVLPLPPDPGDATANAGGAMFVLLLVTGLVVLPVAGLLVGAGYALGRVGHGLRIDGLRSVSHIAAALLLGAAGTGAFFWVVGRFAHGLRAALLDALYGTVGPTAAWQLSTTVWFTAVGSVAVAVPPLLLAMASAREDRGRVLELVGGFAGLTILAVVLFAGAGYLGVLEFSLVAVGLLLLLAGHYVVLRSRGGSPEAVVVFVGGLTLLLPLVFLFGSAFAAGGSYHVVATAVPTDSVERENVARFDDVPAVRDALFSRDACDAYGDRERVCRLPLDGSRSAERAVAFLAENGVRCVVPAHARPRGPSFVAEHDGTRYRVTCEQ